MIGKLFALFPSPGRDVELTIAAYIDETAGVPAIVLSHALRRVTRRAAQFAPTVAEILRESARVIREAKLQSEGRPTHEYNGHAPFELNVERWLQRATEVEPLLLPAGRRAEQIGAGR